MMALGALNVLENIKIKFTNEMFCWHMASLLYTEYVALIHENEIQNRTASKTVLKI